MGVIMSAIGKIMYLSVGCVYAGLFFFGDACGCKEAAEGARAIVQVGQRQAVSSDVVFPEKLLVKPSEEARKVWASFTNDMRKYLSTDEEFTAGSVYHNAVWGEHMVAHWLLLWRSYVCSEMITPIIELMKKSWWSGLELSERESALVALAAFLHPIGMCGDGEFIFEKKDGYAERGAEYILGTKKYVLADGTVFDIPKMLSLLGLSIDEQKHVALLVRAVPLVSEAIAGVAQKKNPLNDAAKKALQKIREYGASIGVPAKDLNEKLVREVFLVAAASSRGLVPEEGASSVIFGTVERLAEWRTVQESNHFYLYDYAQNGFLVRDAMLVQVQSIVL